MNKKLLASSLSALITFSSLGVGAMSPKKKVMKKNQKNYSFNSSYKTYNN